MSTPVPARALEPAQPVGPAHPWRRVLRTILANLGAFLVVIPIIVNTVGLDPNTYPRVGSIVVGITLTTAALTRVLAIPQVEQWLQQSISWLAANDVSAESVVAVLTPTTGEVVAGPASPISDGKPVEVTQPVVPVEVPLEDATEEDVVPELYEDNTAPEGVDDPQAGDEESDSESEEER